MIHKFQFRRNIAVSFPFFTTRSFRAKRLLYNIYVYSWIGFLADFLKVIHLYEGISSKDRGNNVLSAEFIYNQPVVCKLWNYLRIHLIELGDTVFMKRVIIFRVKKGGEISRPLSR